MTNPLTRPRSTRYPRFDLLVNGYQGIQTGRIEAVHFRGIDDTYLELSAGIWPLSACPRFSRLDGFVRISRRKFPIIGYSTWVGNWCWDSVSVTFEVGADLLNYLKSLGWHCEGGTIHLGNIWDGAASGGKFRPSDVAAACMTAEELAERKARRPLHMSAAKAIDELVVGLSSQIEISNMLRTHATALEARVAELEAERLHPLGARIAEMAALKAGAAEAEVERLLTLRPASEWPEDLGCAIWWHIPVCEPPIIGAGPGAGEKNADGTPTDCARLIEDGWLTHWSPLPEVWKSRAAIDAARKEKV